MAEQYRLYYWPSLPGRGEFPRLLLEEAQADYVDVGRLPEAEGGGIPGIAAFLKNQPGLLAFAPPILVWKDLQIAQTGNICLFLGKRLGLLPDRPGIDYLANQLQMTILDVVDEAHNTHHPLGVTWYYQEQQAEAKRAAAQFLSHRLPRLLGYLERVLVQQGGEGLLGDFSYVDLSLFQLLRGLAYGFPKGYNRLKEAVPHLVALGERVAQRPRIAAYLRSDRCLPFNDHGVFRCYPELDLAE